MPEPFSRAGVDLERIAIQVVSLLSEASALLAGAEFSPLYYQDLVTECTRAASDAQCLGAVLDLCRDVDDVLAELRRAADATAPTSD